MMQNTAVEDVGEYKSNAQGHLIPLRQVREIDLARDELVLEVEALSETVLRGAMARDLAAVIGLTATLKLVQAKGGLTVRIPLGMTAQGQVRRSEFVELIGLEATTRLIAQYGGTMLYVPSCRQARLESRDQAINRERNRLAKDGCTERVLVDNLALQYRLSARQVWRILKKPLSAPPEKTESRTPSHVWS